MTTVLWKAASFIFIMLLGALMRKAKLFGDNDYAIIIKIVLNITLPAAIIGNFATMKLDFSLLLVIALGFLCNLGMVGIGWLITHKRSDADKALYMLNLSGYNIGAFVIPYAQSFFGPMGVITACMFDAGNAVICTGGGYALTSAALKENNTEKMTLGKIVRRLVSSAPFVTYTTMLILTLAGLRLPDRLFTFISPIGQANTFAAMFMIGLMFRFEPQDGALKKALSIVGIRVLFAVAFALLSYFCLPFPLQVRQALAVVAFAPISVASPAFTVRCGGDSGLAGFTNSLSIAASVILLTCMMLLIGTPA
ncbi:MAG: AEC family transporter [Oscillospiraceae bacterium]|nr:AEC family transporter [Oscillospiraceae bacterium]